MMSDRIEQGQKWWARLPGSPALAKVSIEVLDPNSVELKLIPRNALEQVHPVRFALTDVYFVDPYVEPSKVKVDG